MILDWVQKGLSDVLGFRPYPATLNLRLQSPEALRAWNEIQKNDAGIELSPPDGGFCCARLYRVEIEGPASAGRRQLEGAVLLPEIAGYPDNKIELVAPLRLKDEWRIRDGDQLTLEFVRE